MERWNLPRSKLDDLILMLAGDGFEVIGPKVDQSAIVYGPIGSAAETVPQTIVARISTR